VHKRRILIVQRGLRVTFPLIAILVLCHGKDNKPSNKEQDDHHDKLRSQEVTFSTQVWEYPRVYPLLDGLLQDVAATQVSQLTLNPNGSNGTNLDALQQSFQLQLQYSQLAGIQNAATAQVASANTGYQTQLAQLGTQLLQQFTQATAVATQAQAAYNSLSTNPNATAADVATAQQVLTAANAMVTNLSGQITNLKAPPAATVPTAPAPLVSAPTSTPSLGSTIQTNGSNAATNGTPSFPATKQMDNQMDMLWERLSRLVGVMSRPDSMPRKDDIFLVQFNTSIDPLERKKELLDTTYELNCDAKVIDLFPRVAALNITEDKYRDTSFGLGAVLNFFGFGGTVAYNREHLRASQLLGQSSYITGHGVGQKEFGWLFGISLGDDSISPGTRTTFALIEAPQDGGTCTVKLKNAVWTKPPKFGISSPTAKFAEHTWPLRQPAQPPDPESNCSGGDDVCSIEFSRIEYDPTTGRPAPVMITVDLKHDMDQQQTVTVNGVFVPRVRDNFGRAITASSNNSGGVLEAQGAVGTNTWIPIGPRSMLLNLDSSLFGVQFPRILLSSPSGSITVGQNVASQPPPKVTVSGRILNCASNGTVPATPAGTQAYAPPNGYCLPSLGFQKSTPVTLGVARWIESDVQAPIDFLSISVISPPASGTIGSSGGIPPVQVVSDQETPTWGANAEVDWFPDSSTVIPLSCVPGAGSRLLCRTPKDQDIGGAFTLQVIDQNHTGGPIKGLVSAEPCDSKSNDPTKNCRQPLIWKTNSPVLVPNNQIVAGKLHPDVTKSQWNLRILLENVDAGEMARLTSPLSNFNTTATIACETPRGRPCTADFTINRKDLGQITDSMKFEVFDSTLQTLQMRRPAFITNLLTNMKPLIGAVSADFSNWYGQNLVYDQIVVNSKTYPVDCASTGVSTGFSCSGTPPYGTAAGIMYFLAADANLVFPFIQVNTSGTNTSVVFTPPKTTDNGGAKPGPTGALAPKTAPGGSAPSKTAGGATTSITTPLELMMNLPVSPEVIGAMANVPRVRAEQ
jgi:hypothetical protein